MNRPERITSDEVLYSVKDHIATITLNAPQRMNTISGEMLGALTQSLVDADADREVRCVILTGAGRAFAPGSILSPRRKARALPSAARAPCRPTSTCATLRRLSFTR